MPEIVRFDHYEVLTRDDGSLYELGRGAMGVTYKAMDTNLKIPVCLKVIAAAHLHSEVARQRFIREARSAARLRNPHVAAVYHLGAEGETYFYAMEFIDGETVDALIKRNGPLPPKLALAITDQVAKAFQAAEPHGLVHRDIKPANLMVIRDDDALAVKVIDFGLAKSSLPGDDSATLSMGGFVGTPHFASPEQLEEKNLDVRSDLYSLGVTLWFMLAGRTPFGGSMAQVMSQHLSKPPPFEKLNVPAPLAALLRKLLEKDPENRPQNAMELRRDIARCLVELDSPDAVASSFEPVISGDEEQNFVTLADPSMFTADDVKFEPGSLVAARYRIIAAHGDSNLGRIFQAQDQSRAEDVRIIVLHQSLALNPEVMSALERTVEKLSGRPHANVMRIDALETIGGTSFIVLEWTEGSSLVEVLRVRRELQGNEVIALLSSIGSGVDHALSAGVEQIDPGLHHIQVTFPQKPEEGWLQKTQPEWPPHAVKLNPLSFKAAVAAGGTWAGNQTVVDAPVTSGGSVIARTIRSVAAIAYELLGGKISHAALGGGEFEFKPLASLSEAGNEVLRRAFSPEPPFSSVRSFTNALAEPESADLPRHHTQSTLGPSRTEAGTVAAYRTEGGVAPAPIPQKKSSMPVAIAAVAVLAAGGAFFALKKPPAVVANPTSNPSTTNPSSTVTNNSTNGNGVVANTEPEQPPQPTREEMFRAATEEAKDFEAKKLWAQCIAAWVKIAQTYPELESAWRANLEGVCVQLRERPNGFSPDAFVPMKQPLIEAAQLGVLTSMMVLAENLRMTDPIESCQWFEKAGQQGDWEGLTQAGLMISNGMGPDGKTDPAANLKKAAGYFEKAAANGHAAAQMALAECLMTAKGVERNIPLGIEMFRKSVSGGNDIATIQLAQLYLGTAGTDKILKSRQIDMSLEEFYKLTGLKQDIGEAVRLFESVLQKNEKPANNSKPLPKNERTQVNAVYANLGSLYIRNLVPDVKGEDAKKKAFDLFRKGADVDDVQSMFFVAQCYEGGLGTKPAASAARLWYERAAAAKFPPAVEWLKLNPK